jgi:hypothetical protein
MIRVVTLASFPLRKPSALVSRASHLFAMARELLRTRLAPLTNPYHPERHYMRGPGPKWREKHPEASVR